MERKGNGAPGEERHCGAPGVEVQSHGLGQHGGHHPHVAPVQPLQLDLLRAVQAPRLPAGTAGTTVRLPDARPDGTSVKGCKG